MWTAVTTVLLLASLASAAAAQPLIPVDMEVSEGGHNYDDVCFWRNPQDPDASLIFVTSKSDARVEAFRLDTGAFVGAVGGFERPVNCDVTGDLLVTTDSRAGLVRVHHIPTFTEVRHFGVGLSNPQGVTVLEQHGRTLVYVTDVWEGEVHAYDLATGAFVLRFSTGFFHHEGIAADELYGRILVGDDTLGEVTDEGLGNGRVRAFSPSGEFLAEFGAAEIGAEAEGITIYRCGAGGWIIVSDQRPGEPWSEFEIFERASLAHVGTFVMQNAEGNDTDGTDGVDVFQVPTRRFPAGVFAACDSCVSGGDDVDIARWETIAATFGLAVCPEGRPETCGNGVQESPFEECDGADDQACPGACGATCVCPGTITTSTTTPTTSSSTSSSISSSSSSSSSSLASTSSTSSSVPTTIATTTVPTTTLPTTTVPTTTVPASTSTSSSTSSSTTFIEVSSTSSSPASTSTSTTSSVTTPSSSTTTLPEPAPCGDGIVDAGGEECDGADDALCPGTCQIDCRCAAPVATIEADVTVMDREPDRNFGSGPDLWADAETPKLSFLRVRVTGVGRRQVTDARLRLTAALETSAGSDSGGRLRTMSACSWAESLVTWNRRPAIDGPIVAELGPVSIGAQVAFDVTAVVSGDGVYCFALDSVSADGVTYGSRETSSGPALVLALTNPPVTTTTTSSSTSTSTSTSTSSSSTSTSTSSSTSSSSTSSTTATEPSTTSTTFDVSTSTATTPTTTSTTVPPPRCGDGVANQAHEECDGADDAGCLGACLADCRCAPVVAVVEADAGLLAAEPEKSFGTGPELWADAQTPKRSLFRIRVSGIGDSVVEDARLLLRVGGSSRSTSDSGGRLREVSDCNWDESKVTWKRQPEVDGVLLDEAGPAPAGATVSFDISATVIGDGVYCFALDSRSANGVTYDSREVPGRGPSVTLLVRNPAATTTTSTSSTSTTSVTTSSSTTTTATMPPRCGDGTVNQALEECDGGDAMTCPGACRLDCRCAIPTGTVETDVTVMAKAPQQRFGQDPELWADADTTKRTFLRVRITGFGERPVGHARLLLTVGQRPDALSETGGRLRSMTECSWDESSVTWDRQPRVDGALLDEMGPVGLGAVASFDVTGAVTGDGLYCFALESPSEDGVMYNSRESSTGRPAIALVLGDD